jgi:hypothetical protein
VTAISVPEQKPGKHIPLLSGKHVEFRRTQMLYWGIIVGILGTCFVAGAYFGFWEVNWYVHIGPVYFHIFYLKPFWDGGSFWPRWIGHWAVYRHAAFRDLLEPEVFIMAIGTLLAKPSHWDDRCSNFRLIVSPVILLVLAVVLNTAGVWLLNFGLPASAVTFFGHLSLGDIILGFAIGHLVLRPFWAPVGSLLQGNAIDVAVALSKKTGRIPLWEERPLAPPVVRERFAVRFRNWVAPSWKQEGDSKLRALLRRSIPWTLTAITVAIVLITVLGGMAKYGFAHGWHVAYLYPRS